ncbi:MAG TPA: AAA family ATPase [Chitinophagaceae bacterium]|nr:AAA family ATPase [Chitinophagaceae bacterium]
MLPVIIISMIVLRILAEISPEFIQWLQRQYRSARQRARRTASGPLFNNHFVDVRSFYLQEYRQLPSICFIDRVDATKALAYIEAGNCGRVLAVYQRNTFNWQQQSLQFSETVLQLQNHCIIELGEGYAEIYYGAQQFSFVSKLIETLRTFGAAPKEQAYEINIITLGSYGLELKPLAIAPTVLDTQLYYNEDFAPVDAIIRERLARDNDKGIILLHGLPGTGKTTYLRHLIGGLKKKVLFVSPAVAGNLMNPDLIDLLLGNPNAVLVIEDAENIIMDRKYNSNSSVSNLLNLSDGLLSDCLNVQIICTFNSSLSLIDGALLRKGRLIAKYEFGKLSLSKARKLAAHLGVQQPIERPMTVAEIANADDDYPDLAPVQTIGFRKEVLVH